jgi:hypothetical protein
MLRRFHHMTDLGLPTPSTDNLDPRKGLLDLHISEYSALTTRITYWIAIQYGLFGLAGALLVFAVQEAGHVKLPTLVLSSALVIEVLIWAVLQTQYEIFNTAQYIEWQLKPKIAPLLRGGKFDNSFWGWEPYLKSQRGSGYIRFNWRWAPWFFVVLLASELVVWALISGWKRGAWINSTYLWSCWGMDVFYVFVLLVIMGLTNFTKGEQIVPPDSIEGSSRE